MVKNERFGTSFGTSFGTRRRPIVATLLATTAAAFGARMTAAGDGAVPAGWWQFDRTIPLADETGSADLLGVAVPLTESVNGIELSLELPAAPSEATSLTVAGSAEAGHWSAAADGLTVAVLLEARSPVMSGAAQRLLGRGSGLKGGGWRLDARPTASGSCAIDAFVGTEAGVISASIVVDVDVPRTVLLDIDPAGGEVRLESRAGDGRIIDSASVPMSSPPIVTGDPLIIGTAGQPTGDVAVGLDLVAGWSGQLSEVDRDRLTSRGKAARYAAYRGWPGVVAPGYQLQRVDGIMTGDRRHVIMGDSFTFAAGFNRVYPSLIRVGRFEPFTAVATGVRELNPLLGLSFSVTDPQGNNPRGLGTPNEYRCEYLGGVDPQDFYGLPTNRVVEFRGHPGATLPADGRLFELRTNNAAVTAGETDAMSQPGEPVGFRLVHRRVSDAVTALPAVRLTDVDDSESVLVDLTAGVARQAAATPHQFTAVTAADGEASVVVREPSPGAFSAAGERFMNLVSVMAWRVDGAGDRVPGQYLTSLHDSSWSWLDYGQNFETNGSGNDKAISREQLANWLEATTLDPNQPMTFWWYVDMEGRPLGQQVAHVRDAIDVADGAANDAGLPRPTHLLIVPHMHQRGGRTNDELLFAFETYRAAFDAIVDDPAYDHVARFSIFDATDGVFFDGRPASIAWLADRGYDEFTWGEFSADLTQVPTLLDASKVHPSNASAAAFYASFIASAIEGASTSPCVGDVTEDGIVDFDDLIAVIGAWGPCPTKGGCNADLDQDGVVGLGDLLEVLSYWDTCRQVP